VKKNGALFGAAVGDVHENHRGIDESMLRVELGVERAGVVPEGSVLHGDCAGASNAPGEFVEFFDGGELAINGGLYLLDVAAKIADLIESVPSRHLKSELPVDVRDFHGDVEEVLLGLGKGDLIADGGTSREGEEENNEDERERGRTDQKSKRNS